MQALTKVVAATGLALVFVVAGCSGGLTPTQQSTMKGGMMGAVGGVALGRTDGAIMKLQLRQRLTVSEFVVANNEIALLVVRPVGIIRLGEHGRPRC